jgi:hypothetical protein
MGRDASWAAIRELEGTYRKSRYRKSQYRKSRYRKSQYRKSRYRKSQYRKSRYRKSQYKKSRYRKSQCVSSSAVIVNTTSTIYYIHDIHKVIGEKKSLCLS